MSGAGWYADPLQRAELRWYDGSTWREHVRTGSTNGTDPLDPAGVPLAPRPVWNHLPVLPAGPVGRPVPVPPPRGPGRRTMLALVGVVVVFVLLVVVGIGALLVLVRNSGAITTSDIEQQIGSALGEQRESSVTVSCPPVIYLGDSGGTIECTATDLRTGADIRVQVTIKRAKVTSWSVLGPAAPDVPPSGSG